MIELSDNVIGLSLFVSRFLLEHLQVLLVALLLLSNFGLVVLDGGVVALLCTLTLFLKTSLESVALDLEEALQLEQLLLRLLLHLAESVFEVRGLLIKLLL